MPARSAIIFPMCALYPFRRVELASFVNAGYGFRHLSRPPLRVFRTRSTSMVALVSKKSQPAGVTTGLPVTRPESSVTIRWIPSASDSAILRPLRVPPGHRRNIGLFGSQCLHRIEARCTPRGNDTCERGHREQGCGNCGINRNIERLDLIEQVAHQSAGF